jgi:hypothetical protein
MKTFTKTPNLNSQNHQNSEFLALRLHKLRLPSTPGVKGVPTPGVSSRARNGIQAKYSHPKSTLSSMPRWFRTISGLQCSERRFGTFVKLSFTLPYQSNHLFTNIWHSQNQFANQPLFLSL